MPYYTFGKNDILYNRIEANPHYEFVLYTGSVYLNNFSSSLKNIPNGYASLTEYNVSRPPQDTDTGHTYNSETDAGNKAFIFPFHAKGGSLDSFGTVSKTTFRFSQYGEMLTGSYTAQTASLARYFVDASSSPTQRQRITALRTTFERYTHMSKKYQYSNFESAETTLICVPSIFFGSAIKKRSVRLKYYITGTLAGELHDLYGNGELIQVSGSSTGTCQGVVLYREGFIVLTGSTSVTATTTAHDNFNVCSIRSSAGTDNTFKWIYWGEMGLTSSHPMGACSTENIGNVVSSSYSVEFKGTTKIPVLTMFAHAPKGELNFSSNPTYVANSGSLLPLSPKAALTTKIKFNTDDKASYAEGSTPKYVSIWGFTSDSATTPKLQKYYFKQTSNSSTSDVSGEWVNRKVDITDSNKDTAAEYAARFALEVNSDTNALSATVTGSVVYVTPSVPLDPALQPSAFDLGTSVISVSAEYAASGSSNYVENKSLLPANTISSSYAHHSSSLLKQTFISYIKIYDEHHDCIAVAKLARPIKKLEERGYTFKLKLDI